jgi:alpha-glucosidase
MPWRADAAFAGFSAVEPWLPLGADHPALAVDRQLLAADSVLTFTRRFLRWRRDRRSLVDGDIRFLPADEPVVAFLRGGPGETLLVVLNLGADAARWRSPAGLEAVAVTGHGLPSAVRDGAVDLPPFGGAYLAVGANAWS